MNHKHYQMIKRVFLSLFIGLVFLTSFGQTTSKKMHAFKMLVVHNTDGSTKGWLPCDFNIELTYENKELNGLTLDIKDKNVKVRIKKRGKDKFNYQSYLKDENLEYRTYTGFDDLTGEDVKIQVGYNTSNNQLKPISITLIYELSSNYIALN